MIVNRMSTTNFIDFDLKVGNQDSNCTLYPIKGYDDGKALDEAVEEVSRMYKLSGVNIAWRDAPHGLLVRIYLDHQGNIVIEGNKENFGSIYHVGFPKGFGVHLERAEKYLGITAAALQVFGLFWDRANVTESIVGDLNWWNVNDRITFSWKGESRVVFPADRVIGKTGNVKMEDMLFTVIPS